MPKKATEQLRNQHFLSATDFANYCSRAWKFREDSWDKKRSRYKLDIHQVVEKAGVPEVWHWPVYAIVAEQLVEYTAWVEENMTDDA